MRSTTTKRSTATKLAIGFVAVLSLLGSACGSKKSSDTTLAAAPETSAAPVDTTPAAPETTAAPAAPDTTVAAPADTTAASETTVAGSTAETTVAGAAPAATATAYGLKEWAVEGPATLTAGKVELAVTNNGSFPHEFIVFKGTYETAPKGPNGEILEDQLPGLAEIGKFGPGETKTLSVDLPAGAYFFSCNLGAGPNSHAAKGQHIDVTVA